MQKSQRTECALAFVIAVSLSLGRGVTAGDGVRTLPSLREALA